MEMGLDQVLKTLEEADRVGARIDKPEGYRYIMLSETLVNIMRRSICDALERLKELESLCAPRSKVLTTTKLELNRRVMVALEELERGKH
jgi:hypothetical protein